MDQGIEVTIPMAPIVPMEAPKAPEPRTEDLKPYVAMLLANMGERATAERIEGLAALGSKSAINRELLAAGLKAATPQRTVDLSVICAALENGREIKRAALHDEHEHRCGEHRTNINYHAKEMQKNFEKMSESRQQHEIAIGKPYVGPNKVVADVLKDPFLTFGDITPTSVSFNTNDCVVGYKNDALKIDMSVNFGRFKIEWFPLADDRIIVYPLSKNIKTRSNYFHPHLSGLSVCLGNAKQAYGEFIARGEIDKAIQLVRTVLCSYNPDSPYETFQTFYFTQNRNTIDFSKDELVWAYEYRSYIKPGSVDFSVKSEGKYFMDPATRTASSYMSDRHNQEVLRVKAYSRVSADKNVSVDGKTYIQAMNNKYMEISEEVLLVRH